MSESRRRERLVLVKFKVVSMYIISCMLQEKEFKWLLDKEYQLRVEGISNQLRECSKKFFDAFTSSGGKLASYILLDSFIVDSYVVFLCRFKQAHLNQSVSS